MQSDNSPKNILLIDDDVNIRLVIKKLLLSHFKNSKVFTSGKGVEGLGLAYIIKPDVLIIDTTLPKYSGREVIDFISTNKAFENTKIILLHEGNDISNLKNLGYSILSKKEKNFSKVLLIFIGSTLTPKLGGKLYKFSLNLSNKIISFANLSNTKAEESGKDKNILKQVIDTFGFIYYQIITSFYLTLFLIFVGRFKKEENIIPDKEELRVYRSRVYPAFALVIATVAIISIQFTAVLSSFIGTNLLLTKPVRAAAKTWDGGGGADTNWSTCTNWDLDACPASGDNVTFNSTSTNNVTVDSGFGGTIGSITIASGYTGTITLARSLTITGTFSQADGTFNGSSQTMSVGSAFTLTAGIFTSTSSTMTVANAFSISGSPTFNANSGTIAINASLNAVSMTCNNVTFNLVTFTGTGGTISIGSDCTIPLGANPNFTAFVSTSGTLSGSGTLTLTSLSLSTGYTLSGFSGIVVNQFGSSAATANFSSYTTFTVTSTTTLTGSSTTNTFPNNANLGSVDAHFSSGTFNAPSGTLYATSWNLGSSVTFNANSGTLDFTGNTGTITCASEVFNLVTFTGQTGLKTITGCTLPLGSNPTIPNGVTLTSTTLSGSGTITQTSGGMGLNSSVAFSGFTGIVVDIMSINSTSNFGSFSTFAVNSLLSINSGGVITIPNNGTIGTISATTGTINAPGGTMVITGSFNLSGTVVFNANSGTVNFSGGSSSLSCNNVTFNVVTFTGQSAQKTINNCTLPLGTNPTVPNGLDLFNATLTGSGTLTQTTGTLTAESGYTQSITGFTSLTGTSNSLTVNSNLNLGSLNPVYVGGNFTQGGGTFTAPSGTLSIVGDFTKTSGTFTANGGTVNFTGGAANINGTGVTFGSVSFSGQTGIKTISSANLAIGTNPTIPNGITLTSVTLSGSGTITNTTGTLTLNSGSTLSGFTGLTGSSNSVVVSGGTLNMSSYTTATIIGSLTESSGSLTLPTGTLTVNGSFVYSSGSFTNSSGTIAFNGGGATITCGAASLSTVTINSSGTKTFSGGCTTAAFTLTAGTVIAPSATLTVSGSFTLSSGTTFTHNSGIINFTGGTATINCNSQTFNSVNFSGQTASKTVNSNCNLPLGANPTIPNGILLSGTLSGSGTITQTTGTLSLNSGASLSGFTGLTGTSNSISIVSGSFNFGSYNPFVLGLSFDMFSPATFTAPSGTMYVANTFNLRSGTTFNANGGTIDFNGASNINCNNQTFNSVTFAGQTGTMFVGSTCSLPLGSNPTIPNSVTLSGTLSGSGTLTSTAGTLILSSGATLSGFTGIANNNLTVSGATVNLSSYSPFTVANQLSVTSGSLTIPSGADFNGNISITGGSVTESSGSIHVAGSLTVTAPGTFNASSGTIVFDTTVASTSFSCGSATLGNVEIAATGSGSYIMTSDCTVNSFTMTSGTWLNPASAYTLFINGDYTENASTTFGGANLTVQFAGTSLQNITKNAGTFSSKFFVANTGIVQLATAFTVTTQICQVQGGGSIFYTNGSNFICLGGFTVGSGGTVQIQGGEGNVTAPTLSSGSTVIMVGNGNGSANSYTVFTWTYTNSNLVINSTDGTLDTFTFNSNITAVSVTLTAGTLGKGASQSTLSAATITMNGATWTTGAITITNSSALVCSSGTMTATSATINGGSAVIAGCTFSPPSGTYTLTGDFTFSGGSYTTAGTLKFNGSDQNITCGSATLNTVTFTAAGNKTFLSNCNISNTVTGTLGTIGATGTIDITTGGLLTISGATWTDAFHSITANAGITCSSGSMDNTSATVDVNGTLTVNGCTFTAPSGTMTINTNFTKTTGTFDGGSGTVTFDGSTQTVTCGSAVFNTVNFTTSGTKTLSGTCTTGAVNMNAGTINMSTSSPWTYTGLLTINGADFSPVANTVTANAGITCSAGSITSGTATFTVTGTFLISGCTFTQSGATTLTASTQIECSAGTFSGNASALNINGHILIDGCTFTAPSGTMSTSRDFTFTSGVYNNNSGIVAFDGVAQNITCGSANLNTVNFTTTGSSGGVARGYLTGEIYNGKIYYWGGYNGTTIYNRMDIFDISTSTWSVGTAGGAARYTQASALYNGKIYYWGGYNAAYRNNMYIYDIATDSWTTGTTGGTIRGYSTGVVSGGKIYFWGGYNGSHLNTMDIYDIGTDSWSTGTAGGTARRAHQGTLYGGKIYYWGGFNGATLNTVDIYDIGTDSWSTGTAGGTARQLYSSGIYNGKIYYWAGQTGNTAATSINTMDIYDIATDSWTTGAAGGTARYYAASVMYNSRMYNWGGLNAAGTAINTIDVYDITTDGYNPEIFHGSCSTGAVNMTAGTISGTSSPAITASGLITANGSVVNAAGFSITANAGITCSSGTFNQQTATIDVNGTLTLSGCAFTATTGTMTISTNFTKTTGSFDGGSGTVTFDGSTQTVTCGSATFNTMTFSTAGTKTLSGTCTTGDVNMNAGTIGVAASSPWTMNGLLTINGADYTTGAATSPITIGTGISCSSGSFTSGLAAINDNGYLTVSGCTFTAPAGSLALAGNFTYSSGTFTHNSGTITLDGGIQVITCGTTTLNTLTFSTGGSKTFSGNCTAGAINMNTGVIGTSGSPTITANGLLTVATGNWTTGTAGGTGRVGHIAEVYNHKMYIWGGCTVSCANASYLTNTVDILDLDTNVWTTGTAGGTARAYAASTLYNGKIYLWGGCIDAALCNGGGTVTNNMDIYDIASDSWSTGAAGGTARGLMGNGMLYNGKIYYTDGWDGTANINTVDIYDIAGNSWSTGAAGGTARRRFSNVISNGKIYIWAGYTTVAINTLDIYDIVSNTWTTGATGGTARNVYGASLYQGKIYAWGGLNASNAGLNTMNIYDIASDTWSTGVTGGTARYIFSMVLYDGKLYAWGGSPGPFLNTVDIFNLDAYFTTGTSTVVANAGVTCSSGWVDGTSATAIDVNGSLTVSGCSFTSTTNTMTIDTNFTYTTGTFNQTSGTVTFDGGTQAVACGGAVFNTVNFTTSGTKTLSGTCTTGATNMTNGTINMATTSPWTYNGLLTVNGATFSPVANSVTANAGVTCSSGTITGGTATFSVTGNFLVSGCTFTNGGNTITASSGVTCSSGTFTGSTAALSINGDLTINGCAFTATSNTMSLSGNYTYTSGTFTAGAGTISIDGDTQTISCGTSTLNTVNFDTGGAKTFIGDCTMGNINMYSGIIGTSGSPTIVSTGTLKVGGGNWTTATAGGNTRQAIVSIVYNNKVYNWGGTAVARTPNYNTMDIYDLTTDTWSTGTAGGTGRYSYVAQEYNGKIYYLTGCTSSSSTCAASTTNVDIYDIGTDSWSTGTPGGTSRGKAMSALFNGKIYIFFGQITSGAYTTTVDIYDIGTDSWSTGTAGGTGRQSPTGDVYNGKVYIWGGYTTVNVNIMEIYDINSGTWSTGSSGGTARRGQASSFYNGEMYTWGGFISAVTNTMYIYDPAVDSWYTGTTGGTARFGQGQIIYDGKMYEFLGSNNSVMYTSVDVYNLDAIFTTGNSTFNGAALTCSAGWVDGTSALSMTFSSNYTVSGCTFTAPTGTMNISGNYSFNSGNVIHNGGTVEFNGASPTLNSGCSNIFTCTSAFYNVVINKANPSDTISLTSTTLYVTNNLTITEGVLVQPTSFNIRVDGVTNIDTNGTWSNTATGDIWLGNDVVNNGNMTLEGTTSACNETDAITINSTSAGVQRAWSGTGSFVINDVSVQDQGGTAIIGARSSTNVSGNGSNWLFLGCTTASPITPSSLSQTRTNDAAITTGGWTNESSVKFTGLVSDIDNPDGDSLCVEVKAIGVSFANTEDGCGVAVSYSGTPTTATYTATGLTDGTYHWQARTKDLGGSYSSWLSYGGNAESATDFALDSTAPTGGTVYDGTSTGVDVTFNGGSGTSLSANWSGFDFSVSGISSYDYSIGTTAGATDVKNWTSNSTSTSVTATGLTLQTLVLYYFNVRANDVAGNSTIVSSNGQYVSPSVSFSLSSNTISFSNLNNSNGYSDTQTTTISTSTDAYDGYLIRLYKTDSLRSTTDPTKTIDDFSAGSYSSPSAWPGGIYGFGYTSNDTTIQGVNKFGSSPCPGTGNAPCYAPFSSTPPGDIVADHTATVSGSPVSNEQFVITYKVQVPNTQPAGTYTTTLIYSITPQY